jgi:hypothetical protein
MSVLNRLGNADAECSLVPDPNTKYWTQLQEFKIFARLAAFDSPLKS